MVRIELYGGVQVAVDRGEARVSVADPRKEPLAAAVRQAAEAARVSVDMSPAVADFDLTLAEEIAIVSGLGPAKVVYHVAPAHDPAAVY